MKLKKLLGIASLAAAAVVMSASIQSVPASAATPVGQPLPVGVFQIQSYDLECADAVLDASNYPTVLMDPCDPLNLDEQFTYDPLTQQILSVGHLTYCLTAALTGFTTTVIWQPCDAANPSQRFQQTGPDSSGWTRIFTTFPGAFTQTAYLLGDSIVLKWTNSLFQTGNGTLFRFLPL